ncbi:DUF222 domain-containing protein, partial [Rhodococcus sp. IEGM 1370]|uniref:DUF222 domain-containing protein n=1 Tax=Rhodococcus sp. IEGM 1370 TaxID=3082222 RepID=UPI002953025E
MGAIPTVSLEALTAAAHEENRQAARKITACYRVHCDWLTRDTKHKHYSRYGRTEMAVALGCSATVAEAYVSVGVALHTRMPLLRAAFETGEIDLPRVRTVCRILDNLSDDIVTRVEAEVVEAARRSSPGPLEQAIWDILLRVAPEEAAALREFAKKFRTVTYSPAGELARIRAELTAPEAAAAWQLLEEMADTLCPKDPRGKKERLCDAFMARMHGEPRLACLCQREDCPKKDTALPDRRVPLTMITVDIATLIGLLANPAYLAGHGSIDPDLARELARSSHWQILLTEAVTLAEKLGLAVQNPDTGEWERTPKNPTPETEEDTDPPTNTDPAASTASAASRTETRTDTASATDSETGCGTSTDTDATTAPETEPANESAASNDPATESTTAPSPTPASSPTSVTATTTSPSPTSVTATATAPAPATAADSASGPGTNPGRGSDAAQAPAPIAETAPNVASDTRSAATQHERSDTTTAAPTDETSPAMEDGPSSPSADTSPHTADSRDNQRRPQSLTSAAALFCTHTPLGRGTRHSSALDLDDIRHPARNMRAL